jgi:hypothetical protein
VPTATSETPFKVLTIFPEFTTVLFTSRKPSRPTSTVLFDPIVRSPALAVAAIICAVPPFATVATEAAVGTVAGVQFSGTNQLPVPAFQV